MVLPPRPCALRWTTLGGNRPAPSLFALVLTLTVARVAALPHGPFPTTTLNEHRPDDHDATPAYAPFASSFTLYSDPIDIRYGEAFPTSTDVNIPLPQEVVDRYADGTVRMAIAKATSDIVQIDEKDGSETRVPLWHVYSHHAVVYLTRSANETDKFLTIPLPFHTRDVAWGDWNAPLRQVMPYPPTTWSIQTHLINTHKLGTNCTSLHARELNLRLSQCPCTPQRVKDLDAGTLDGAPFNPWEDHCSKELLNDEGDTSGLGGANPVCQLETYDGGEACCNAPGTFVIDTDKECAAADCSDLVPERFYFKATIYYEDEIEDTVSLNEVPGGLFVEKASLPEIATQPGISMARSTKGNDYIVRPCAEGTPTEECVHTLTWVERASALIFPNHTVFEDSASYQEVVDNAIVWPNPFQLVKAYPHVHAGVVSALMEDASTNETLCEMSIENGGFVYGTSNDAGNEYGYLVAQHPCFWDLAGAPVLTSDMLVRSTMVYNASRHQTGAMAFWLLDVVMS